MTGEQTQRASSQDRTQPREECADVVKVPRWAVSATGGVLAIMSFGAMVTVGLVVAILLEMWANQSENRRTLKNIEKKVGALR